MREAKRLSQFDHPNIVKVIDVFEENGTAYMVMDYVEGETLQQLVDRKGKLTEKEALDYIIPLCDALEVVHEKGLLHLDIKPSNILIKKQNNTPVLIDFGISKFTEVSGEDHSTTTPVALTKGYAPLEQYGQDLAKLTTSTDVYSVAATLYKLVTGVTPPEAAAIVQDGIKPPKEINPDLSGQLNSIILQSLSVKPIHRAQSISKLKAELKGISNQEGVRETEVLYSDGNDDKNKPLVAQQTEVATEVLSEIYKPEPKKADTFGTADVKNPKSNNSIPLWLMFAAVIIVIIIFRAIYSYTPPNAGNEAGKTETVVNSTQSYWDIVSSYSEGLAAVKKNKMWGYIDSDKILKIPLIYDEAGDFKEGKAIVKLNGTRLEIHKNGEEVKRNKNNRIIVHDISSQQTTTPQTIISENPVTDIDGNVYKTVKIGKQVWMAENLKVTRYRNGDEIRNVTDNTEWKNLVTGAWCFYNNVAENGVKYGKLYNWYAVTDSREIAPGGWHVPSSEEWDKLDNFLGQNIAADQLKEKGPANWLNSNPKVTNKTNFTALPGGERGEDGIFANYNQPYGNWWSSSNHSENNGSGMQMSPFNSNLIPVGFYKKDGLSVRCVKN